MASKMASDDFDDQFLTCSVCMLHFRDPRILPCLHTFCKECLQLWAAKQQPLECPTCRTEVSLPDQGMDGLRSNFYVNNLLDFAAAKEGAEPGVPCQVCGGGHDGVKSWCTDCAVLLCEFCTETHPKIPGTSDHELLPQVVMKAKDGVDKFQRIRHCRKHKRQELAFYCETCNALVCTACTVIDHRPGKDHNPVEIATVAQEKKETLRKLLQEIDPRLREIQASIEEVDKKMSKLSPSKEAATTQAKAYFRRLADLLQKREKEILDQIDEQCRADGKALQTKKEAIEFELAGLTSAQTFCQQAVEHGSDVHIVEVGNQVQTRLETLLTKQLNLESNWSEFQFVENTSVTDCAEEVKSFGGLETNVDVSKCKVVVKPAVQGFRCATVLNTMDEDGFPCLTNSKAVTTNMKDPSGENVPTQVQMKSEGVFEISYLPKVTGEHRLKVNVNLQHVAGSPFDVNVQSRDTPVLTIGQKGGGVGQLRAPLGVAVDMDGNIVVVERGNKRVQIFDADKGHSLKCFSVDGENPYGVDVDSNGRFVVTSWGDDCGVRCYSQEGELLNILQPGCMRSPHGLTVLKDGRMMVADPTQNSCLLLQPDGSLIRKIGKGQLRAPRFIAVDESRDMLFVTDNSAHRVFAFDLEGELQFSLGNDDANVGIGDNDYVDDDDVEVDVDDNDYVVDVDDGDGWQCYSETDLVGPTGITIDQAGNIIVVNRDDGRVQVFGPNGTFIRTVATVLGGRPNGITLTPDGYIAVACFTGHCVEMYRYN